MYRYLFRTVYTARNSFAESCVFLAKCGTTAAPLIRVANGGGVRALSTNTAKLCEKKDGVASTNQADKTNAHKEADPTETSTLVTQKAEDDVRVIKMDEQSEEPVVLKTDNGSIMQQQQVNVKTEQAMAKPKQGKTGAAKSGKENLLDLLGAMKVEVTNKRKRKSAPMPTVEASSESETLNPELIAAAFAAASTLPNSGKAESELLQQLRQHEAITETEKKGNIDNLGVLIADMKVRKKPNLQKTLPVHQIQFDDDGRGYIADSTRQNTLRRRFLFSRKRLNIFSPSASEEGDESTVARPSLWDIDFAHELSLSVNQTLSNRLEEMIQWTKEGKLWQYPINNETGLEEEASVSFAEHIFLEKHLEEGFPREGPVRHFMELVVAGLSRNPYLTIQQKKEHIFWFRDYFHQKEEVLKEAEVYLS